MKKIYSILFLFFIVFILSGCINDEDPIDPNEKIVQIVDENASLDTVGTEVMIGTEHFYVITSDSTTVTMLAKYNLLVGKNIYNDYKKIKTKKNFDKLGKDYGENILNYGQYGLQSKLAIGHVNGEKENIGVVPFSSTIYWDYDSSISSYENPLWVYNSNSNIYQYVENYKNYLINKYNIIIHEARLIKYEELSSLGCRSYLCFSSSIDESYAPSWVSLTTYWSGSLMGQSSIWNVGSSGGLYGYGYLSSYESGVRPVIVIPKNLF